MQKSAIAAALDILCLYGGFIEFGFDKLDRRSISFPTQAGLSELKAQALDWIEAER